MTASRSIDPTSVPGDEATPESDRRAYDLESVKLPRMSGRPLRLFARALNTAPTRAVMMGPLLKQGGITRLRARPLTEAPTFTPLALYGLGTAGQERGGEAAGYQGPSLAARHLTISGGTSPAPTAARFVSALDLARAYRAGTTTPEQVAERALAAISASDRQSPPLRAFIAIDEAEVRAMARAAGERLRAGRALGLLDGVPVAIKDELDQQGFPTTGGTRFWGRAPATADATVVARLRAAGAVLLGKANMHEVGCSPNGGNPNHGTCRNPYDLGRDAGGSSSGSAAAVAAGFCPLAVGADGGGSIRIPAALCGVVGLKATFGRISEHGALPLCWSVAHVGPIGATVDDVALGYALMAGPDPDDAGSLQQPAVTLDGWDRTDLRGVRLGVFWPWFEHAAPSIVAACRTALDRLVDLGAVVRAVTLPELDLQRVAHAITILSEMAAGTDAALGPGNSGAKAPFSSEAHVNLSIGRAASTVDYLQAQRMRTRAWHHMRPVLAEVDAIITPATAVLAPQLPADLGGSDGWSDLTSATEVMRYVVQGNFLGLPAISFPVAHEAHSGLPIAMQAMGRPWDEALLLCIARLGGDPAARRPPTGYLDLLG
jgi:Asp-tRNA(Asn)/Glu-tRNA(Gln) amidotransferase A subunit family amidase